MSSPVIFDAQRGVVSRDRALLYASLRRPRIISSVEVGASGALAIRTVDWWDHWRSIQTLGLPPIIEKCVALRAAWNAHIGSGFTDSSSQQFCFRYWALLEDLVGLALTAGIAPALRNAIAAAVTFESFSVMDAGGYRCAAATTTVRNPVYLLARVKWPTVPHSTRFLPLIALANIRSATFGHYRRYPVSPDGELSILVYPRNQAGGDPKSLSVISTLANRLGATSDPFVVDRSQRLWDHVLRPLIEEHAPPRGVATFEFIDLGAGTGAFTAELCGKLVKWAQRVGIIPRLHVSLIDNGGTTPSERFSESAVRSSLLGLSRIPVDYRSWLLQRRFQTRGAGLRFALACKVFDMASRFDVRRFAQGELPSPPAHERWFDRRQRSPARVLARTALDGDNLLISPYRFEVSDGHVLSQPALSDYFAGLSVVTTSNLPANGLYLPVRQYEPSALITSDGRSVLAELLNQADFVLIEDADLRPQDLMDHVREFALRGVVVNEMTAVMGLTGNYSYLLSNARVGVRPIRSGERLL